MLTLTLMLAAAVCLIGGFGLPLVHSEFRLELPAWLPGVIATRVRAHVIGAGRIPVGDRYLWQIIRDLFAAREYVIGLAILIFSVLFPCAKIAASAVLVIADDVLSTRTQRTLVSILAAAGKWSMVDVFVVAVVIVLFKADPHFAFEARPGIYCYAASAVLSSVAVGTASR